MNPFEWLSQHWITLTGWVAVFTFLWRAHKLVSKLESYGGDLRTVREDTKTVMTNHIPHLQKELETVNKNIEGLREDFKEGFGRLADSINVVLTRIQ